MGMLAQLLAGEGDYTGANFIDELSNVLVIIISAVGVLLILYAVYIFYLFATATDDSKRKGAKNRLVKVIASVLIIYALAASLRVITVTFTKVEEKNEEPGASGDVGNYYEFEYIGTHSISIEENSSLQQIILDPNYLRIKNGGGISGAVFNKFSFDSGVGSALYNRYNQNTDPKSYVEDPSGNGCLTFNFSHAYTKAAANSYNVLQVNYYTKEDLPNNPYFDDSAYARYVLGQAMFEYNGKTYSINIWIEIAYWPKNSLGLKFTRKGKIY